VAVVTTAVAAGVSTVAKGVGGAIKKKKAKKARAAQAQAQKAADVIAGNPITEQEVSNPGFIPPEGEVAKAETFQLEGGLLGDLFQQEENRFS